MTLQNRESVYGCINRGQAFAPGELQRQAICVDEDIGHVFQTMTASRRNWNRPPRTSA